MSALTRVTADELVSRLPTSDADISSDGEEFCDSFDVSSFHVRLTVDILLMYGDLSDLIENPLKCYL